MQTTVLRIGTRGSPLALAQAHETRARLMAAHGLPEEAFAIDVISTSGDRIQDRPLSEAGGKGLFTKEIEEALLAGRIDIAVHSSKDMPTQLPEGLELSAFLPREDPRDAFIGKAAKSIAELPQGATVGSSSLRRQALILRMRPDLEGRDVSRQCRRRGCASCDEGVADGTILAHAGLKRLGLAGCRHRPDAAGHISAGAGSGRDLHRKPDRRQPMSKPCSPRSTIVPTGQALACERAFLAALDGSCRTPIAGYATIDGDGLSFNGLILSPDGRQSHDISARRPGRRRRGNRPRTPAKRCGPRPGQSSSTDGARLICAAFW